MNTDKIVCACACAANKSTPFSRVIQLGSNTFCSAYKSHRIRKQGGAGGVRKPLHDAAFKKTSLTIIDGDREITESEGFSKRHFRPIVGRLIPRVVGEWE